MGKVLVLFDSATGNTEKMAKLVAEGAGSILGIEVRLRMVAEAAADDVLWCDGIALGSPTNMGLLSWKMIEILGRNYGSAVDESRWQDRLRLLVIGRMGRWIRVGLPSLLTVLMNFGFLVFGVTDYASELMTAHYGAIASRQPYEDDVQAACRMLGKRLAEWVAVFCDGRKDQHPLLKSDTRLSPA